MKLMNRLEKKFGRYGIQNLTRFSRGLYPYEFRRIAQIEIQIFLIYLIFNLSVFFKNECIIVAAYHKDLSDPIVDQRFIAGVS